MAKKTSVNNDSLGALGAIEHDRLYEEIENHAQIYGEQCDRMLVALKELHVAKATKDSIEGQLYLQYRRTASISGDKTTEKKLRAEVESTSAWQQANVLVMSKEYEVDKLKFALKTLDRKGQSLELLARSQIKELGAIGRTA